MLEKIIKNALGWPKRTVLHALREEFTREYFALTTIADIVLLKILVDFQNQSNYIILSTKNILNESLMKVVLPFK